MRHLGTRLRVLGILALTVGTAGTALAQQYDYDQYPNPFGDDTETHVDDTEHLYTYYDGTSWEVELDAGVSVSGEGEDTCSVSCSICIIGDAETYNGCEESGGVTYIPPVDEDDRTGNYQTIYLYPDIVGGDEDTNSEMNVGVGAGYGPVSGSVGAGDTSGSSHDEDIWEGIQYMIDPVVVQVPQDDPTTWDELMDMNSGHYTVTVEDALEEQGNLILDYDEIFDHLVEEGEIDVTQLDDPEYVEEVQELIREEYEEHMTPPPPDPYYEDPTFYYLY